MMDETTGIVIDALKLNGYGAMRSNTVRLSSEGAIIIGIPFESGKLVIAIRSLDKRTGVEWLCAEVEDWDAELQRLMSSGKFAEAWKLIFWLLKERAIKDIGELLNK